MKKVLVITDNNIQYERVKELITKSERKDVTFDFRRSESKECLAYIKEFRDPSVAEINVRASVDYILRTYDLVLSIHCIQFFPKDLVNNIRCVNVHPGYNPFNRGWYPQVFSLAYDLPIGATIHEIDNLLDHGPIIARKLVEKTLWDTSATLYHKVLRAEIELLEAMLFKIVDNEYLTIIPEEEGKVYYKKDFERLCELDLNEEGTFKDFYDRLRALSHEGYQNAYFIDEKTGRKINLNLSVTSRQEVIL